MNRKMKINTLGQVLKYYRKKHDFRQEKLCSGICSVATLSKIERGNRILDSLNAECLLGRMGKEVLQFEILLNDEDYAAWNLREEIQKCEKERNYKKVAELLQIYEKQMPQMESVHEQFLLYHRAKVKIAKQAEADEITALLYHALKCTKPEMDTNEEKKIDEKRPGKLQLLRAFFTENIVINIKIHYDKKRLQQRKSNYSR